MKLISYYSIYGEYPHLRGAASRTVYTIIGNKGISPPAWGSPVMFLTVRFGWRNIPTCVGQPLASRLPSTDLWEYPHLRGAALMPESDLGGVLGISPPAWGSQTKNVLVMLGNGNIPTCVGQPPVLLLFLIVSGEYPHLRGAALRWLSFLLSAKGISPPAWGSQKHQKPM